LRVSNGVWGGGEISGYSYKWYRCENAKASGSELGPECELISNSTSSEYTVQSLDEQRFIRAEVTATNLVGSTSSFTATSLATTATPVYQSGISLTAADEYIIKTSIVADVGIWSGSPTPQHTYQWYACNSQVTDVRDTLVTGCVAIRGATKQTLIPEVAQKGKFLLFAALARNDATNTPIAKYSASTTTAIKSAPTLTASALGSGGTVKFVAAGNTGNTKFTVNVTTWGAAKSYTYQWHRCDQAIQTATAPHLGCQLISGETKPTYTASSQDVGKYISPYVTTVSASPVSMRLGSLGITMQVPRNTETPSVTGAGFTVGQTLNASAGTWQADPTAEFKYQWLTCSKAVPSTSTKNSACLLIPGATSNSYEVPAAQNGKFLQVRVTAANASNSPAGTTVFSATTPKVLTAPNYSTPPMVSATPLSTTGDQPIEGATVKVTSGAWSGSPIPTKTYQWYLCDVEVVSSTPTAPDECSTLVGETGLTLRIGNLWHDKFLTVAETVSNDAGSKTVLAASTKAVKNKPKFDSDPTTTGTPRSNSSMTAMPNESTEFGSLTIGYRWASCANPQTASNQIPSGCTTINNAVDQSYRASTEVEGKHLVVEVTLANTAGKLVRVSASTQAVSGPLSNTSIPAPAPASNKRVQVGEALFGANGKWSGFPIDRYSYQWYECSSSVGQKSGDLPSGCNLIQGATQQNYTPTAAEAAKYLVLRVSAHQDGSNVEVFSPSSEQVFEAPRFTSYPTIGSEHVVGEDSLSITNLTNPVGTPTPIPSFRWFRCPEPKAAGDNAPSGCSVIPGANSQTYSFVTADIEKYIVLELTYRNVQGTAFRYSASSTQVAAAPTNTSLRSPNSGGTQVRVGVELQGATGEWSGFPSPTFTYSWYTCLTKQASVSENVPFGCSPISGATGLNYTPTSNEAGEFLLLRVRGVNAHGIVDAYSPTTGDIFETPRFVALPAVTANRNMGQGIQEVSVSAGHPAPSDKFQWFRCAGPVLDRPSAVPNGCVQISKATSSTYSLSQTDVEKYLLVRHTLTSPAGSVVDFSLSSQQILRLPEIAKTLKLTGNTWNGGTLTLTGGAIVAFPQAERTVSWYRCNESSTVQDSALPSGCVVIPNQDQNTYQLVAADQTKYILARVKASNTAGTSYLNSSTSAKIKQTPTMTSAPYISGKDVDDEVASGATISANVGVWTGDPAVNYAYQWYLCNTINRAVSDEIPAGCSIIRGQTSSQYTAKANDALKYLAFTLKVSNGTVDVFKFSGTTDRVYTRPEYRTGAKPIAPSGEAATDGSPRVGYFVEATNGTWNGKPDPTFTYQWFSCSVRVTSENSDSLPDTCSEIIDATGYRYTVTQDHVGRYLGFRIKGTYKTFDEVYTSTLIKPVISPPINVEPQVVSGYPYVHATLRTTKGVWEGNPPPTETHTWWVCDDAIPNPVIAQPTGCTQLPNSSGNWKVTEAQVGKHLVSAVKSSNAAGSSFMWSESKGPITTGAINEVPPSLSVSQGGEPRLGVDLLVSDGRWLGSPDPMLSENLSQFQYFWYRCEAEIRSASESLAENCVYIETDATKSYSPVTADLGKYILVAVRGYNSNGESVTYSASTRIVNQVPENVAAPMLSGQAFVQREVTSYDGSWVGAPTPALVRQWLACDSIKLLAFDTAPGDCAPISGATGPTFTPTSAQLEKYLVLRVTGTNIAGSDIAWSASSEQVVSGPVNKAAPSFVYPTVLSSSTNPVVGERLRTNGGEWTGNPTPILSFQWFTCNASLPASDTQPDSTKCSAIQDATSATYVPTSSERGAQLLVQVHAVNQHGEADKYSATTTPVLMAPVLNTAPSIQGPIFNRSNARAKGDTWLAVPEVKKSYVWYSCVGEKPVAPTAKPNDCDVIPGATTEKFLLPPTPWGSGRFLLSRVTATNSVGSAEAFTVGSVAVKPGPVNLKAPTVSGSTLFPNNVLSGALGSWSGNPSPTLTSQWYRCSDVILIADDELDSRCAPIAGQVGTTYRVTQDDPGYAILFGVTGTNPDGSSTFFSKSTLAITQRPTNVQGSEPSITGAPKVSEEESEFIVGNDGTWVGYPRLTYKKQWFACKAPGNQTPVATKPVGCDKNALATGSTLKIPANVVGKVLVYAVTATNTISNKPASATVYSAATGVVANAPVLLSKPFIKNADNEITNAAPVIENKLTAESSWKAPKPAETYQWYRCDQKVTSLLLKDPVPDSAGCVAIAGETAKEYTVKFADSGKAILVEIIGSNSAYTLREFTNSTELVAIVPTASVMPTVTGVRSLGDTLTVSDGVWENSPAISYLWYRCINPIETTQTEVPNGCQLISGAAVKTYTQTLSDQGKYVTAAVRGTIGASRTTYLAVSTIGTAKAPINTSVPTSEAEQDLWFVDSIFVAGNGTWDAAPAPTFTYQWYQCSSPNVNEEDNPIASLPSDCKPIAGETNKTYRATQALANDQVFKYLMVKVTATNTAGTGVAFSDSTDAAIESSFREISTVRVTAPSLEVKNGQNVVITGVSGTWTKGEAAHSSVVHRWVYCETQKTTALVYMPDDCEFVFGQHREGTPRLAADSQPLTLEYRSNKFAGYHVAWLEYVMPNSVVSSNSYKGFARIRLSPTTEIIKEAPSLFDNDSNFFEPTVSADALAGVSSGVSMIGGWATTTLPEQKPLVTWRGVETGTYEYQWFACDSRNAGSNPEISVENLPSGCSVVAGATAANFTPTSSLLGKFVGVQVTALNSLGEFTYSTATSNAVTQEVDYNPAASPSLNSISLVGETATLNRGSWVGTPTPAFEYIWYLCSSPLAVDYQVAAKPSNCSEISGASTSSSSVTVPSLSQSDATRYVVVRVKGTNKPYADQTRSVAKFANVSSARIYESPSMKTATPITLSTVSNSSLIDNINLNARANVGETLVINNADPNWLATPLRNSIGYSFEWYRCTSAHDTVSSESSVYGDCTQIAGANTNQLLVTREMQRWRILGRVIANNGRGAPGYAMTVATAEIKEAPYVNLPVEVTTSDSLPPLVDVSVSAKNGTWSGYPTALPISSTYQWYRCTSEVATASTTLSPECTTIERATQKTYLPGPEDRGLRLIVRETARNPLNGGVFGTGLSYSKTTERVNQAPTYSANPAYTGIAHFDQTLNFTPNSATILAFPAATVTHAWYSCTSAYPEGNSASIPAACVEIANTQGLTSLTINDNALLGKRLTVVVKAQNSRGIRYGYAATSPAVTKSPVNLNPPVISSGAPLAGATLTATGGSWSATPSGTNEVSYTYAWYQCDSQSASAMDDIQGGCSVIVGQTTKTLPLTREMAGKFILVAETLFQRRNNLYANGERVTKYSSTTSVIKSVPQFNGSQSITGDQHVGETVAASYGSVDGFETPTISYTWYSCSSPVVNSISGCTSLTAFNNGDLTIDETMSGRYLTYVVNATNSAATTGVQRIAPNAVRVTKTPQVTASPALSGDSEVGVGKRLTVSPGTWSSSPAISTPGSPSSDRAYSWYLCTSSNPASTENVPSGCSIVTDSAGNNVATKTLDLIPAYRGKHVVAVETVTATSSNKIGANVSKSVTASVGPINMKPAFDNPVSFAGAVHVGEILTAENLASTGYPTPEVSYNWYACETPQTVGTAVIPANCSVAPGATANEDFEVTLAAAGKFITLFATSTSSFSTTTSSSVGNKDVTTGLTMVTAPALTGGDSVGSSEVLSTSNGSWNSTPATTAQSFSYAWYLCESEFLTAPSTLPLGCVVITNESSPTLVQRTNMAGKWVMARVTVQVRSNVAQAGNSVKFTNTSARIKDRPVFGADSPLLSGFAHEGETLTASEARFSGFDAPTSTFQWWMCTAAVTAGATDVSSSCSIIPGEDERSISITGEMTGKRLVVVQTIRNSIGSSSKSSASTAIVTSTPGISVEPLITGSTTFSANAPLLTVSNGTWSGAPDPNTAGTFTYSWYRCSAEVQSPSNTVTSGCSLISGATSKTYRLTAADVEKYLVSKVTVTVATNKGGSSGVNSRFSASSAQIYSAPAISSSGNPPAFKTGATFRVGATVEAGNLGTWTGTPEPNLSYSWYSCTKATTVAARSTIIPSTCSPISGFDDRELLIPSTAFDRKLLLVVTGTNSVGSSIATSSTSVVVSAASSASFRFW
jgi:hypothetical protein